jgi:hypothetical protein
MKSRLGLAVLVTLVLCAPPAWADGAWRQILHFTLDEYGDPAIARQGYLDIWANEAIQSPYGYPYAGLMHVDGICDWPVVNLQSSDVNAWVSAVVTDYAIIEQYDPDAEWAAVFPYDDRRSPPDGSWGYDSPVGSCPDVTPDRDRHGFLALFFLPEEDQRIDGSGNRRIGNLYACSEERGCTWYYVHDEP